MVLQDQFSPSSSRHDFEPAHGQDALHDPSEKILALITSDLQFLIPLLRKFPKCYWVWNHRLWMLQQSTILLSDVTALRLWREELGLVNKMLSLDSRNFHGWGYRRTVVAALEGNGQTHSDSGTKAAVGRSLAEEELTYTTKMIGTDLSNFSAWHNRSKLIPRLLDEQGADAETRRKFLDDGMHRARFSPHAHSIDNDIRVRTNQRSAIHRSLRSIPLVLSQLPYVHLRSQTGKGLYSTQPHRRLQAHLCCSGAGGYARSP